jgi:hypothetical protein
LLDLNYLFVQGFVREVERVREDAEFATEPTFDLPVQGRIGWSLCTLDPGEFVCDFENFVDVAQCPLFILRVGDVVELGVGLMSAGLLSNRNESRAAATQCDL